MFVHVYFYTFDLTVDGIGDFAAIEGGKTESSEAPTIGWEVGAKIHVCVFFVYVYFFLFLFLFFFSFFFI